jgi:hypothetical protein
MWKWKILFLFIYYSLKRQVDNFQPKIKKIKYQNLYMQPTILDIEKFYLL